MADSERQPIKEPQPTSYDASMEERGILADVATGSVAFGGVTYGIKNVTGAAKDLVDMGLLGGKTTEAPPAPPTPLASDGGSED